MKSFFSLKCPFVLGLFLCSFLLKAQTNSPIEILENGQNVFMSGDYEAALGIFGTGLQHPNIKEDTIKAQLYGWQGKALYYLQRDSEAFEPFRKAIELYTQQSPLSQELAKYHVNVAGLYRWQERHYTAIDHLDKSLAIINKNPNDQISAVLYTELGANYRRLGDFAKALLYQDLALKLAENSFGKENIYYLTAAFEKGILLRDLKDYKHARVVLKEALKGLSNLPQDYQRDNLERNILQGIGNSYSASLDWENAEKYYQLANEKNPDQDVTKMLNLVSLSGVSLNLNKLDQAKNYSAQASSLASALLPSKSIDLATQLETKAKLELAASNFDSALYFYQQEIIALVNDFEETDILALPKIKSINACLSIDKLTDAIALKSRAFFAAYKKNKNLKHLQASLDHLLYFDRMVDLMRQEYMSRGTKLFWSDISTDAFEVGIEVCMALHQQTKDEQYLHRAFYFSEKNKALLLLESFQNSRALESANIPKELVNKERSLRLDIADFEMEIRHLKEDKKWDESSELNHDLAAANSAYQELIQQLEKDFPKYYEAKFSTHFATVEEVRSILAPNQSLIEYFVGDHHTFIFKITADVFEIKQVDQGFLKIEEDAKDLIYHTVKYFEMGGKNKNENETWEQVYSKLLYQFYQNFIQPVEPLSERLIIIPSGALAELPFNSFISAKPKNPERFVEYDFLVNRYAFSQAFSATSLLEFCSRPASDAPNNFLGFAPAFTGKSVDLTRGNRFSLSALEYNDTEVEKLYKLLDEKGHIFVGAEAIEQQFHDLAYDHKILHFSTHGLANSLSPDYSMLFFSEIKDSIENEYLYVRELYNTQLRADMVVLSACETGIGKLHRGEGVASLARAFSFAGAKSIFTTLWVVNDQATAHIVQRFYELLLEGYSKDVALQTATSKFYKTNPKISHPFCWAPYIIVGDTANILGSKSYFYYYIIAGFVGFFLMIGVLRTLSRKKETA